MGKRRWLLLKAIEYNWDLTGPGDWTKTKWLIFSNGSYKIVSMFNPSFDSFEEIDEKTGSVMKKSTGRMDKKAYVNLRKALKRGPWRDPSVDIEAFDGIAWEIESYRDDGSIEKTSGGIDYIYGHRVLEKIVSLLPSDGNSRSSNACISINRNTPITPILRKIMLLLIKRL